MSSATSRKLLQSLISPAKFASKLDWKRLGCRVLSLDIHKNRIGLALSTHPSLSEEPQTLETLRFQFKSGKLPNETKQHLERIANENDVCGIVVSWPVQKDTGHLGAGCGRTLHVLEELAEDTSVINDERPLCFWDSEHSKPCARDSWGRCPDYSRTSDKNTHLASIEQYGQDDNVMAANVWGDFAHMHWPKFA